MKRFLIISLLTLCLYNQSKGCAHEWPTHNYYMFCIGKVMTNDDLFKKRTDKFWKNYTKGKCWYYHLDKEEILAYADSIKDAEAIDYITYLNKYLSYNGSLDYNQWQYPTRENINNYNSVLEDITKKAKNYNGKRFKAQWCLLYMRANMLLQNHQENISYWENEVSKLNNSVYKEMAENIYAGALYHTGKKQEAFELFAKQGDFVSISWAMRDFRSIDGMKQIYNSNPNSFGLYYLIQYFVNSIQNFYDILGEAEYWDFDNLHYTKYDPYIEENHKLPEKDIQEFISFAQDVLKSKYVEDKCVWNTAVAMLYHIQGERNQAKKYIDAAMSSKGRELSKDNARAIRLLIYAARKNCDENFLYREFTWLDSKVKSEKITDYCFSNAKERILTQVIAPKYKKQGDLNTYLAAWGAYDKNYYNKLYQEEAKWGYSEDYEPPYYFGEFFERLDSVNAQTLEKYYSSITNGNSSPFKNYLIKQCYKDKEYFCEMIGTKYLAQNQPEKAIPYLEQVSVKFINKQNIGFYMQRRTYNIAMWDKRQLVNDDGEQWQKPISVKSNQKLQFCQDLSALKSQYDTIQDTKTKQELAYKLATLYYQASYKGDCWYLTDYYKSNFTETPKNWQKDFRKIAEDYLNESKKSKDLVIKGKSLYALAYYAPDGFVKTDYDYINRKYTITKVNYSSQRGVALREFYNFRAKCPKNIRQEFPKCDYLKFFAKKQ